MGLLKDAILGGITGGWAGAGSAALQDIGRPKNGSAINPNRSDTPMSLGDLVFKRRTKQTPDYTGMGAPNITPDYDPSYQD